MSLVGSLEDLSLGDLLQIVSMSQKSGVLVLGSNSGSGQIVFRTGLVHAAGIKGRTPDLRRLLIEQGLIDAERLDALSTVAGSRPATDPAPVVERAKLDPDQVDDAIRKSAEAAIFEMFSWASGEFSFDARREGDAEDPYPCLRNGINAQYLAMEGMRLRDEQAHTAASTSREELGDDLFFGSEPLELDGDGELELDHVWEPATPPTAEAEGPVDARALAVRADPVDVVAASAVAQTDPEVSPASASQATAAESRPVVVIDPEAAALEWVKTTLEGRFARIHVFQRAEQGLARIRQYLIRGEVPVVLLSPSAPIDPLSGIHGQADFVKRLRTQASRIVVVGLREAGEGRGSSVPAHLDAVVHRPPQKLRPGIVADKEAGREQLLEDLSKILDRSEHRAGAQRTEAAAAASARLDAQVAESEVALVDARSQNEVLSILVEAAASVFARTAILALRDGEAFPIAGRGIEALEIDPLANSPRLACPILDTSILRRVIDSKRSLCAGMQSQADRLLVAMFGPIEPRTAYLAPIVGPGGAVAILYGDQGKYRRPIPDTAALERLVEHAGKKLGVLAAERAKRESGPRTPGSP